jgi:hypothetical protein
MNLDDVAEDLVERSRLGEQNATAHISLVGEQYRSGIGGDSVKRSYEAIWTYLQNGPRKGRRRRKPQPPLSPDGRTVLRAMSGFGAEATDYTKRCGYLCALPIVSAGTGGMCCAVVLLACGPTIGRGQIEAAESALATPEALKSFNAGLNGKLAPDADPYAYAGHAFRKATAIQRIRRDPKPAHFDMLAKGLGWELGG